MLDDHQFTLLIVAVGLGALLVSFSTVYHKEIDVLTAELEVLQGEPSSLNEGENSEAIEAFTKQRTEIAQRLESLALSLRHAMISVVLLLFFLILLALRMFLWAWQAQPDVMPRRVPGRFLWFDRVLVSILVVLLLHLGVSHLVLGVPLFF
jgi:uncharacterized membrane protein (DUF106 family)